MSFLSGVLNVGKSVVGFFTGGSIASSLAKTALMGYALSRLNQNTNKANDIGAQPNIDAGVRLQLKADASAKIPVLYGTAFFGGNLIDAQMTNSNKTMWYALVLSEKTGTLLSTNGASSYVFKDVYWNEQRIQFRADGITVDYTRDTAGNIDRSLSGLVKVYCYGGSSTAGQVPESYTGSVPAAYSVFPSWAIGTHPMNNLVFALISVDYNRDRGVQGLGDIRFQIQNSMKFPGDVLYDYMTNSTYGAKIPAADIDTATLSALTTYSDSTVTYTNRLLNGTTQSGIVLQDRYQINGLLDSAQPVLENIEKVCSASASWLSYDSNEGKWGVIINRAGTSVASFDDSNILDTVSVSGTGLQDLYNAVKVEFPRSELRDSADFVNIALLAGDRNANEVDNTLGISYDIINEPVQAKLLGFIELKQSRVDKVIQFRSDFGKINLKPGDIIDITDSRLSFSDKLFRIISISEVMDDGGALSVDITALEYDASVYDLDLDRYEVSNADGIIGIGSIGTPGTPQITEVERDARPRIIVESTAPTGIVEGMEFWLTNDVSISDDASRSYRLIATTRPTGGGTYGSGTTVTLDYDSLGTANFIIKTRGINDITVGPFSTPSGSVFFAPVQTTNAIDANTQMFDATGGLLTGLALVSLASKLLDLFGGDFTKSIFGSIFDTFKDVTGIDLVGDAADGSLVVASDIAIKSKGTAVSSTVSSIDFSGGLIATASGTDIIAKLMEGVKHRDILVWDNENKAWALGRDCIDCDPILEPPPKSEEEDCALILGTTLPPNNFTLGTLCAPTTTVPYTGSYFLKFSIQKKRLGATPSSPASIVKDRKYTIAQTGNTDWTFWGFTASSVGTVIEKAKVPADTFPNGKTVVEIVVGKKYKIKTVGSLTAADWEAVGWEGTTPTIGDTFIATAAGTDASGVVDYEAGTGFVYGEGAEDPEDVSAILAPLVKGAGSFKLYGTDGTLEQTISVANAIVHSNVVELPFAPRAPGKDYYIIFDEGVITSCACENKVVNDAETWTFTTSPTPQNPYTLGQMSPITFPDSANNTDESIRTRIDFTYSPTSGVCSSSQKLILTFDLKVKKGTGSITIKNRTTQSTVGTLSVTGSTISEELDDKGEKTGKWEVDFGTIPTLEDDKFYDVSAPVGLLLTDSVASSSTVCDKTTNTPADPIRQSRARDWAFKTEGPLRIVSYELCRTSSGNAHTRSNLKLTFNKPIALKEGTAEVTIFGSGILGGTFQKIDLRGTYSSKKYGDIYDAESSEIDNPDTANNEAVSNNTILINPTQQLKAGSGYYLNIPAGVIIDASCDVPWEGITDSTTVAWQTDGAEASPPEKLTYSSVFFDFKFNRLVVPGVGKLNIVAVSDGRLLAQIGATDYALKSQHNTPITG
jgi:hypothetical protein